MRRVKLVFKDIRILWKFRNLTKKVVAEIDRREVSLIGTYQESEIELAEKSFNAKVYEIKGSGSF